MPAFIFEPTMEFIIPFLFVLAIVFGVLQLVNVFKNKAVNVVIGLAIAFFAVSYSPFTTLLWSQFGNITIFFIAMFFIAFTIQLFGIKRAKDWMGYISTMMTHGGILFILLVIGFSYSHLIPELPFIGSGQNLLLLVSIIFVASIFWGAFMAGLFQMATPQPKKENK
jgi:hypothetical protein